MIEYIKKEEAIAAVCKGCNVQFSEEPCEPPDCDIRNAIKSIPTADVAPKDEVTKNILDSFKAEIRNRIDVCDKFYKDSEDDYYRGNSDAYFTTINILEHIVTKYFWRVDRENNQR